MYRIWVISTLLVVCRGGDQMYRCPSILARDSYLKTFGEKCYQFINWETSWYHARDTCSSRGGCLVQIRTAQIQQFVMESLRSLNWNRNGVWMGAHDLDDEGHWKWVEGHPLTYTNWAPDQPGGCTLFYCGEDCGNLRYSDGGRWHDYPCDVPFHSYSFICEFYMGPATTTTTTTTTTTPQPTTTTTTTTIKTTTTTTTTQPTTTTTTTTTTPSPTTTTTTTPTSTVTSSSTTLPATTTSNNVIPPEALAVKGSPEKQLNGGEISAIVLSLLLLAFIGGFVCAFIVVRRRQKKLPDQEYTVTFDNVTYVIRALNPFQREDNQSRRHLVLDGSITEPPPQYEEIDNQVNAASCARRSDRKQNIYATADAVTKDSPTGGSETCAKTVDYEKVRPPPYDAGHDKKYNIYDVPDEVGSPKEDQTYQDPPSPEPPVMSPHHYTLPQEYATCYETPRTEENQSGSYIDVTFDADDTQATGGASYSNNLYDVSDA